MKTKTEMTVCWERPGDEQETWFWDDYICPRPVGPLTQSFYPYTTQAFALNQRQFWQRSGALRTLFVNGYLYVNFHVSGPAPEAAREQARRSPQRWGEEWLPEVQANLARLRAVDLKALPADDLARTLQEALQVTMRHFEIEGQVDGPGLAAIDRFSRWYKERFPGQPESEPYRLLQGQVYTTVEMAHALWRLTQQVTPPVAEALRAGDLGRLPDPFRQALTEYLEQYGIKTEQMYDIGSPTLLEEPAHLIALLLRATEESTPDPLVIADRLAGEARALEAEVLAQLAEGERTEFETLLRRARFATRSKEEHKFWIEQATPGMVRLICAELAQRMVQAGSIDQAEELAFLTLTELIQFGFGLSQPHLRDAVAARRAEHQANQAVEPRPWLGTSPEEEEAPAPSPAQEAALEPEAAPAGLKGMGASPGVVWGQARVVLSPRETGALRHGEILVCPWTDPDWTPLLGVASAIVTDVGGVLSHAAVVAREYGIPAVVATGQATRLIKTGQLIRVDGAQGIVDLNPNR